MNKNIAKSFLKDIPKIMAEDKKVIDFMEENIENLDLIKTYRHLLLPFRAEDISWIKKKELYALS